MPLTVAEANAQVQKALADFEAAHKAAVLGEVRGTDLVIPTGLSDELKAVFDAGYRVEALLVQTNRTLAVIADRLKPAVSSG